MSSLFLERSYSQVQAEFSHYSCWVATLPVPEFIEGGDVFNRT